MAFGCTLRLRRPKAINISTARQLPQRLVVERLRCVEDSPEWTPDEVYLLVVIATLSGKAKLQTFTLECRSWRRLKSGQERNEPVTVDPEYSVDKIYAAALLEQDGPRDFDLPLVRSAVQQRIDDIYRSFASIKGVRASEITGGICAAMNQAIADLRHDDEPIGRAFAMPVRTGGRGQVLLAQPGHGYRIWFKVS